MTRRHNLEDDLFPWLKSRRVCFSVQLAAVPVPSRFPPPPTPPSPRPSPFSRLHSTGANFQMNEWLREEKRLLRPLQQDGEAKKTIDWMNVVGGAAVIRLCDSDSEQTPCHLESNHEEGLVGWESAARGGRDLRRPPAPVLSQFVKVELNGRVSGRNRCRRRRCCRCVASGREKTREGS